MGHPTCHVAPSCAAVTEDTLEENAGTVVVVGKVVEVLVEVVETRVFVSE